MVILPRQITDKYFANIYKKGLTIKRNINFSDSTSKVKFIVLLNKNFDDELYFAVTTSQIHQYHRIPLLKQESILIPSGSFKFFKKDTVIDLRTIRKMRKDELLKAYNNQTAEYRGVISDPIIAQIDNIINNSKLIDRKIKAFIL